MVNRIDRREFLGAAAMTGCGYIVATGLTGGSVAKGQSTSQAFAPQQGLYYTKEGVKFHVYTSPMAAGASASVIIETTDSLILQDVQQNKVQMDELKSLIQSIGKPLRRIYISHDHDHHWAGLEMLLVKPGQKNIEQYHSTITRISFYHLLFCSRNIC
ncbi:twin-arginine translocation signal domain-containing protein [Planctomycetota bacterium]